MVASASFQKMISQYEEDCEKQRQAVIAQDEKENIALSTRQNIRNLVDPTYREVASALRPLPDPFVDRFASRGNQDLLNFGNQRSNRGFDPFNFNPTNPPIGIT